MLGTSKLVAVYAAPNEVMAELVRGVLESEGVEAILRDRLTAAYAPFLQLAEGHWGVVCVSEPDAERARQVLAAFEEGQGRVSEEELEEAALRATPPDETAH